MCVELGLPGFNEKSVGNIKNLYSVVDFFPTFVLFTKSKYIYRYYLAMLLGNRYQKNHKWLFLKGFGCFMCQRAL